METEDVEIGFLRLVESRGASTGDRDDPGSTLHRHWEFHRRSDSLIVHRYFNTSRSGSRYYYEAYKYQTNRPDSEQKKSVVLAWRDIHRVATLCGVGTVVWHDYTR